MKKLKIFGFITVIGLLVVGTAYAWCPWGSYGYPDGRVQGKADIESLKKFQKESLTLRDELTLKNLELQNEYQEAAPDANRIAVLQKEIGEIQFRLQQTATRYGVPPWTGMYGMSGMAGPAMMSYQGHRGPNRMYHGWCW